MTATEEQLVALNVARPEKLGDKMDEGFLDVIAEILGTSDGLVVDLVAEVRRAREFERWVERDLPRYSAEVKKQIAKAGARP